jgi:hypothetical protein
VVRFFQHWEYENTAHLAKITLSAKNSCCADACSRLVQRSALVPCEAVFIVASIPLYKIKTPGWVFFYFDGA